MLPLDLYLMESLKYIGGSFLAKLPLGSGVLFSSPPLSCVILFQAANPIRGPRPRAERWTLPRRLPNYPARAQHTVPY